MSKKKKFDPWEDGQVTETERAELAAVAAQADTALFVLEHPAANLTPAENVQFDLAQAKKHGAMTLAYLARAGWRLACEKQGVGYGAWKDWCKSINLSQDTADRYIKFYYSTVGEHLRAQGTAHRLVEDLTDKMIAEATAGLESKTATGAMIELGIVKRPPGWGGAREGAGRKAEAAETEAAELAAIPKLTQREEAAAIWTRVMCMIDKTSVLDAVPLLPQKAAKVCYDRLSELAKAMKSHLEEF